MTDKNTDRQTHIHTNIDRQSSRHAHTPNSRQTDRFIERQKYRQIYIHWQTDRQKNTLTDIQYVICDCGFRDLQHIIKEMPKIFKRKSWAYSLARSFTENSTSLSIWTTGAVGESPSCSLSVWNCLIKGKTAVRRAWREKERGFCWTSFTNLQLNLQQNLFIFFLPNTRNRKDEEKKSFGWWANGAQGSHVHTRTQEMKSSEGNIFSIYLTHNHQRSDCTLWWTWTTRFDSKG